MAEHQGRATRARERFLAFRDLGQPDALAEVFDLCAHELLLVAHHLAAPGVAAEDLIQSTFLVAMTHADSFDGSRELMPWLCGILANTARMENRRVRRLPHGRRDPTRDADDPAELAQIQELAAETLRAIGDLPARQREVLTLRLVHGLTPTEIAHALREPVGTVKSWIHRGIQRLRTCLPAGFAASIVLLVGSDRGLAAAKEAVARAAARLRPTLPAKLPAKLAAYVGRVQRHSATSWVAAALLIVGGSTVWNATRSRVASESSVTPDARAEPRLASAQNDVNPQREPVGGQRSADFIDASLRLRARFADGSNASIGFRLTPRFGVEPDFRELECETAPNGEVRLEHVAAGSYELLPDRGLPRIIDVGSCATSIDVDLPPGRRVAGRVIDARGQAVAGAQLWLSAWRDPSRGAVVGTTDAAGRYALRDVPTDRSMGVIAAHYEIQSLRSIDLAARASAAELVTIDFALEIRDASFEGRVVDVSGAPVNGAIVQIGSSVDRARVVTSPHHAIYPTQRVLTDADGSFRVAAAPPWPVRVWARARHTVASQGFADDATLAGAGLRLVLEPGATWIGRVIAAVDAPNVALVESRLVAYRDLPAGDFAPRFASPRAYVETGSEFAVRGLRPGAQTLVAAGANAESAERDVALDDGESLAWSPRLEASRATSGIAIDASGIALEGYRVVTIDASNQFATSVVGADGRFRVEGTVAAPRAIWLHGPEHEYAGSLTHRVLPTPSAEALVVRLPEHRRPSATLRARAFEIDGSVVARLRVTAATDGTISAGTTSADGFTTFPRLPPGDYYLTVAGDIGTRLIHGPITLAANAVRVCDDVRVLESGSVRVRVDGLPASEFLACALMTRDCAIMATYFVLDRGVGTSLPVPAGRYVCRFPTSTKLEPVEVDVVGNGIVDVEVQARPLRDVRLVFHHEELCVGVRLRERWTRQGPGDGLAAWSLIVPITNANAGVVVHQPHVTPGMYRLEVVSCEGLTATQLLEVRDVEGVQSFDVELE